MWKRQNSEWTQPPNGRESESSAPRSSYFSEKDKIRLQRVHDQSMWQEIQLDGSTVTAAWLLEANSLWERASNRYLEQNLEWAIPSAESQNCRVRMFALGLPERLRGYAVCEVGIGGLQWRLGEITLWSKKVKRVRMVGNLTIWPCDDRNYTVEAASGLLSLMKKEFEVITIFLQSVPTNSALHEVLLGDMSTHFWVLPHGQPQLHYAIDIPANTDDFLKGLSYRTRKTVRYSRRQLEKYCGGDLTLRTFASVSEARDFLDDAIAISKLTYQYQVLGLGLRNRERIFLQFAEAIKKGWWRGHILYCKGEAAAFALGFLVGNRYYCWDLGYRPSWEKWSVGTVTTLELISYLISSPNAPKQMDFLYGAHSYKSRLSNASWEEASYYLLKKNLRNFPTFLSLRLVNIFSETIGHILEQYGFKSRVKHMMRRLSKRS